MTINEALLETHRVYEDERLRIAERFVPLELTGGTTLGVLSMPVERRSRTGWVVCHSFGPEHLYLNATEVVVARRLAAAGFPVLRFHAQGYGDSEHVDIAPRPSTHLRDAHDAVVRFREIADVDSVGTLGCRFGATLAALVADEAGLQAVAAIDPVVSGRRYVTNLLRTSSSNPPPMTAGLGCASRTSGSHSRREIPSTCAASPSAERLSRSWRHRTSPLISEGSRAPPSSSRCPEGTGRCAIR